MPVEFHCPNCGGRLKTPDGSEGRQARCPRCQSVVVVPPSSSLAPPLPPINPLSSGATPDAGPSSAAPGSTPPIPDYFPPHPEPTNPYASPQVGAGLSSSPVAVGSVEMGNMLSSAWKAFQRAPGVLIGATLTSWAISFLFSSVQQAMAAGADRDPTLALGMGLIGLLGGLVQLWLGIGLVRISLQAARGEVVQFAALFSGMDRLLPVFLAMILIGLVGVLASIPIVVTVALAAAAESKIAAIGVAVFVLLAVIAYVYLYLTYWPFYFLLVDRKVGVFESFGQAGRLTPGYRLTTFVVGIVALAIVILGFLALCVGLIVAVPVVSLLWSVFYLRISGEPTV